MELEGYGEFSLLGSGGNAHVYEAMPDGGDQAVAVKVLRGGGDEAVNRRFERERKLMAELQEIDGVVPVLDSGVTDAGDPYIVMPLYQSGSLQGAIKDGSVPWEDALEMMRTISGAVAEAHKKRILHLDIKPANVLLDAEGQPHLGDFGIAEMMGSTASMSAAMMTPAFTPPERLADAKPSEQTDVYGLGATLFALLAGTPPFGTQERTNPAAVIASVLNDPPPIDRLPDDVPESAANLVARCMAKDPDERPQTADELFGLLTTTIDGGFIPPASPATDDTITTEGPATVGADPTVVRSGSGHQTAGQTIDPTSSEDGSSKKGLLVLAAVALFLLIGGGAIAALVSGGGDDGNVVAAAAEEVDNNSTDNNDGDQSAGDEDAGDGQAEANAADAVEDDSATQSEVETEVGGVDLEAPAGQASDDEIVEVETSSTVVEAPTETAEASEVEADDAQAEAGNQAPDDPADNTPATVASVAVEQAPTTEDTTPEPEPAPDASFNPSRTTIEEGESVSFANNSSDATSYEWDFGNGSTSRSTSPSHTFSNAGRYTVRLTATGPGGTDTTTRTITVNEPPVIISPPNASISVSDTTVETNDNISFSSTSSGDIDSFRWEFGDGRTSSSSSTSHSYSSAGSYTVRLTVTGPGGSDSTTRTVTVSDPPPPADPPPIPLQIGCQYLGNDTDVEWAFSPLPSLVDTYEIEFSNGSRQDIGRQPGPFRSTDNAVSAIIAVRDGLEGVAPVGSCDRHGGSKPVEGEPGLPTNVTCRFFDFRHDENGNDTWSETWNWSSGGDTDSYRVIINQDGNISEVVNGSSTTHTTVGVRGQSNTGRSVKGIIAVGPGGETRLTISNCGGIGGTGWAPI